MLNWKIIATALVTVGLVSIILTSSPQLGNFIDSLKGRLSIEQKIDRNVSFSLTAGLINVTADASDVKIELQTGNFSAQLKDVAVSSRGLVKVFGFTGSLSADNGVLRLDGTFKKIETESTALAVPQGSIKAGTLFESMAIDNLAIKELRVPNGNLTINAVDTTADSEIIIVSPLGMFEMNDGLKVSGKAAKISIPAAKIFIG